MTRTSAGSGPRHVVVVCPHWSVVAAEAAADEPVVIVHANRVVARSVAAAVAGIRLGHRRRESQARCPEVRVVAHDPGRDGRSFQRVVDAVVALVPRVEVGAPGTIVFAARGPSRYFGGDRAMADQLTAAVGAVVPHLARVGGPAGVGVADGRFAAGVAARLGGRRGEPVVVEPGGTPAFLAPLPLRWLVEVGEVPPDLVGLWHRLGLGTLGDLAALAEADVTARFGWPGAAARRMAAGLDHRPIGAVDPPPGSTVEHPFEEPVHDLHAVVFGVRPMMDDLVAHLAANGQVCTQVSMLVVTDHGERNERCWSVAEGFADGFTARALLERLRWQLEGWARRTIDVGAMPEGDEVTAGVVLVRVEPLTVRADDGTQLGLWGGRSDADDWAMRTAARLAGLVGDEQVLMAEWHGGRHPADTYRWVPVSLRSGSGAGPGSDRRRREAPWPGSLPTPSPAVVHDPPRPIRVVDLQGRAVGVTGRGTLTAPPAAIRSEGAAAAGSETSVGVESWAGPWMLEEHWWDPARHRRMARFQLVTAHGSAYLAAVERQQWWVLAEYR
jgi:protein ImuB